MYLDVLQVLRAEPAAPRLPLPEPRPLHLHRRHGHGREYRARAGAHWQLAHNALILAFQVFGGDLVCSCSAFREEELNYCPGPEPPLTPGLHEE